MADFVELFDFENFHLGPVFLVFKFLLYLIICKFNNILPVCFTTTDLAVLVEGTGEELSWFLQ